MPDDPESQPRSSVPEADPGQGTEPFVPDFDTGGQSHPGTEPFVPDFDSGGQAGPGTEGFVPDFDTGADSLAIPEAIADRETDSDQSLPQLADEPVGSSTNADAEAEPSSAQSTGEQIAVPVQSVTVPGRYSYLKWWKFVFVVLGVWFAAAAVGPVLFFWWTEDRSPYKTLVVFVVLIYIVVCTVAGLMSAMVAGRPLVSALGIALISAPFASVVATAPFYGAFYCNHAVGDCILGIIPF